MILDSIIKNSTCHKADIKQKVKTFINGQNTYTYTDFLADVPVFIFNTTQNVSNISERFKKDVTAVAMMRFKDAKTIKDGMRLICNDKTYDILYTDNLGMQNQVLHLFLKEVAG